MQREDHWMGCRCAWALAVVAGVTVAAEAAVLAPYSNDFSTTASDLTPNGVGAWSLNTTTGRYGFSTSAVGSGSAVTQVTNLGGAAATANDFTMSTEFTIGTSDGTTSTVGFAALGETSTPATAPGAGGYYLADVEKDGTLRLIVVTSGGNTSLGTLEFGSALANGTEYTLTLAGAYGVGTSIDLDLTLSNGVNSVTLSRTHATALTGNYFGFRNRSNAANLAVSFDHLTIVPEPATLALGGLGLLLCAARRRP